MPDAKPPPRDLPFSAACERNKGPIVDLLRSAFADARAALEIGSGTGQHVVHFASELPAIAWQPSDRKEWLDGLGERIRAEALPNVRAPIELDVTMSRWNVPEIDAVYTANSLHIMPWPHVEAFFRGVGRILPEGGVLAVYGPFRYYGEYTSESNDAFDQQLRSRNTGSGIRDFEAVHALARTQGLELVADHRMPAHNQLIVWRRPGTLRRNSAG